MRRTSVSLPTRNVAQDRHEKPARYQAGVDAQAGTLEKIQAAVMTPSQRSRYIKTGGILLFIICLFFYLAPGDPVTTVPASVDTKIAEKVEQAPLDVVPGKPVAEGKGEHHEAAEVKAPKEEGQTPADSSYGTTKCKQSHDKSKPIVQYVLMIDAGSTGSRIHVYKFNNCAATPELEEETFEMTPLKKGGSGLSAYGPEDAGKSLDVLLKVAMDKVPDALKSCTPLAVKATAGLRKLGEEKSEKILKAVRTHLETEYPFAVVSKEHNGVEVMDGKDEGVYAWITTNYLLGKIGGPEKSPTAAVFDLGGGSTQIVFEPTFPSTHGGMPATMAEGDHKYKLSFGGREFELYQHSHLGYGLMSARETIHLTLLNDLHLASPTDHTWATQPIVNPCIARGMSREVTIKFPNDHTLAANLGAEASFNMTGPSTAAPAQCRKLVEKMLAKDAKCELAPCSFNGVHQPSLAETFAKEDVYTFSYFFDRTDPLGMPEAYTLRELQHLASQVCGGAEKWDVFSSLPDAMEQLRARPEWCLDLNFMMALLHTGYEMPIDREVKIAKKIDGNELGWCLGASLPLLEAGSGWQCRIKEVS